MFLNLQTEQLSLPFTHPVPEFITVGPVDVYCMHIKYVKYSVEIQLQALHHMIVQKEDSGQCEPSKLFLLYTYNFEHIVYQFYLLKHIFCLSWQPTVSAWHQADLVFQFSSIQLYWHDNMLYIAKAFLTAQTTSASETVLHRLMAVNPKAHDPANDGLSKLNPHAQVMWSNQAL